MSDLFRWISPFDPRGMTIFGSLAVVGLSVGLWSVNGTLPEIWPHRCSIFKEQLMRKSESQGEHHLNVIAHTELNTELSTDRFDLWEVTSTQGLGSWLIPRGDYVEARVSSQLLAPVSVEFLTRSGEKVIAHLRADYQAFEIYDYIVGSQKRKVDEVNDPSDPRVLIPESLLNSKIDQQSLWSSKLTRRALSLSPSQISCEPDMTDQEIVDVLALILKHADQGLEHAWILSEYSHLSEYRFDTQIHRRLYRDIRVKNTPYRWVWMWTMSDDHKGHKGHKGHKSSLNSTSETPPSWVLNLMKDLDLLALDPTRLSQHNFDLIVVNDTQSLSAQLPKGRDE